MKKKAVNPILMLSWMALVIFLLVVVIAFYYLVSIQNSRQKKIIHFLVDDFSRSALTADDGGSNHKLTNDEIISRWKETLAYKHCEATKKLYLKGDSRIALAFANRPEVLSEKVLNSNLPSGIPLVSCRKILLPSSQVGDRKGTSLSAAMDYVKILISNYRTKGLDNPIIITVTIQHAELDLETASVKTTDQRLLDLKKNIIDLTADKKTFVRIIGPVSDLQKDLNISLGKITGVEICTDQDIDSCVMKVFSKARN